MKNLKLCLNILVFQCILITACNNTKLLPQASNDILVTGSENDVLNNNLSIDNLELTKTISKKTEFQNIYMECIDNIDTYIPAYLYPGTIILYEDNDFHNYIYDWNTGNAFAFQEENYLTSNFSVSPNRKWLAYEVYDKLNDSKYLLFQSMINNDIYTYPYQDNGPYTPSIAYWLNNERLVSLNININRSGLDYISLYHPYDGKIMDLLPQYPNILEDDWDWKSSKWPSVTVYDPSLKYLVYLAEESEKIGMFYKLKLWDREKKTQISEVIDYRFTMVSPIWKMDSSGLIFVKVLPSIDKDEVYFMKTDGVSTQITNLGSHYDSVSINSLAISPDEKYLAIEITKKNIGEDKFTDRLLLLDLDNFEIQDYCFNAYHFTNIVWSPDSRYIAFNISVPEKETSRLVIFDMIDKNAIAIAEGKEPQVWVNSTELKGYFPQKK